MTSCYHKGVITAPFYRVYADELKISASRVRALIETYQNRSRTGLIRLAYGEEQSVYLLFQKGKIVNSYKIQQSSKEEIFNWQEILVNAAEAFARLIPLSPLGLQSCKLAIGTSAGSSEAIDAIHLRASIAGGWRSQIEPRLYQLSWNAAEGIIFFPGGSREGYSIFFSSDRLIDQPGVSPTFSMWADPVCNVHCYSFDPKSSVWQEYILRQVYSEICDRSLPRYEDITGRAMVDTIIRSVNLMATTQNIEIEIASYHVVDREIFPSPQDAARVYRGLLKTMLDNIKKVIGPRLAASFAKEITAQLQPEEQELARLFGLLPQDL